jgi:GDP-D-mannose dehydratase
MVVWQIIKNAQGFFYEKSFYPRLRMEWPRFMLLITKNYREAWYVCFVTESFCQNHQDVVRLFVTVKSQWQPPPLLKETRMFVLRNLNSQRVGVMQKDYVEAMYAFYNKR